MKLTSSVMLINVMWYFGVWKTVLYLSDIVDKMYKLGVPGAQLTIQVFCRDANLSKKAGNNKTIQQSIFLIYLSFM